MSFLTPKMTQPNPHENAKELITKALWSGVLK